MMMNKVKRRLDNQAIGVLPLLLFIFMDYYFSYLFSFIVSITACFVSIFIFQVLMRERIYLFLLLPSAVTLIVYSAILSFRVEWVLDLYSPLIIELLLVVVLSIVGFTKRATLQRLRDSHRPNYEKTHLRTTLNEYYFVSQIIQNVYTLHLFVILLYGIMPDHEKNPAVVEFLHRKLGLILGMAVITYEQIRLLMMKGSLKKEMWLPVLSEQGKVIGCIARSVSRALPKKYFHPVVRVVILHEGMLYLTKRSSDAYVSPNKIDYPYYDYVLFRHGIENTVKNTLGELAKQPGIVPRSLIRYTYEDEKVKHLVSLYVVNIRSEEHLKLCTRQGGKLWTVKQIEDNLGKNLFSEAFEQEFSYLQNTILLAEKFSCERFSNEEALLSASLSQA